MKLALSIAVVLALAPGLLLAAPNKTASKEAPAAKQSSTRRDCATIKSITVRQACLDREAAANPGQAQSRSMSDAVEDLKREDDLLARKLKGICRGC